MKICSKCRKELPSTTEYFHKNKFSFDGLQHYCKICRHKNYHGSKWTEKTPYISKPRLDAKKGFKICTRCRKELPATSEFFSILKRKNRLESRCKNCSRELDKEYRKKHKENISMSKKEWWKNHRLKVLSNWKINYSINKDIILENQRIYYLKNKEKIKKRARKYRLTENGKRAGRKKHNKRRKKGYIEMFPNPFDESENINWHHIDDSAYVVAIPSDFHELYYGRWKYHKEMCMEIIKQIYLYDE